jgi:predicted transcriptional regulator of viral defense system
MGTEETISKLIKQNNGIISVGNIRSAGISKPTFYTYAREHNMEKVAHGIYAAADAWVDTAYILSLQCPSLIFSHEEALYLHGLGEREPLKHVVTVKTGYNPSKLSEVAKVYTVKKELYEIGRTTVKDSFGNTLPVYDLERTICDIVRSRSQVEIQDYQSALKGYIVRKDKNLNLLMEYASKFKVENIIRNYLEVLL